MQPGFEQEFPNRHGVELCGTGGVETEAFGIDCSAVTETKQ